MVVRKKIGLALGSGGARGFALIGVLRTLEKHKIPIDYIAGSSVGAIIGGSYASKKDLTNLEDFAKDFPYKEFASSFLEMNFKSGLVQGEKFRTFLESTFGDCNIEDTEIPFIAMATDKATGEEVKLTKGSMADAMRASSSIPIMFAPFIDGKRELLDGGVSQQVPVDVVKEMGAEIIIAVNLSENILNYDPKSKISLVQHYMLLLFKSLARSNCRNADVIIAPSFANTSWIDNIRQREQIVKEGEDATEAMIPKILELLQN